MRSCGRDCEQTPLARDALQHVRAPILESNPGSEHEVLDSCRGEHLAGAREGHDAGSYVDCQPPDIIADQLDLARM